MNLLNQNENVKLTPLTRKITLNGITKVYPVYKININSLYYNDQNDRIASWISQYKEERKLYSLDVLEREEYNEVIENFIIASNPSSIDKTQLNIELVGQREPGVVLSDGRIIDGNRRYTCIRRLSKKNPNKCWFEAVILDVDLQDSKKMIKMLELTIQHGEEKRVDYNHVEKLIGIYQDIVETELLTIQEYALSTNETVLEVKQKVEASKLLVGFLDYIGMPKQYHVARELSIVSLINDVLELFKKCVEKSQSERLVRIVYLNILMNTIGDSRKFVKNISSLLLNGTFDGYSNDVQQCEQEVNRRLAYAKINNFSELRKFVRENYDLAENLMFALDDALKGARKIELFNKPTQAISKTIGTLREVDVNVVSKMSDLDKTKLRNQISYLSSMMDKIKEQVVTDEPIETPVAKSVPIPNIATNVENSKPTFVKTTVVKEAEFQENKKLEIVASRFNDFITIERKNNDRLVTLCPIISMKLEHDNDDCDYQAYFVDKNQNKCSNVVDITLTKEYKKSVFELTCAGEKKVFLAIKKKADKEGQVRFLYEYSLVVSFGQDIEF